MPTDVIEAGELVASRQMQPNSELHFACVRCGHPIAYRMEQPVPPGYELTSHARCQCCDLKLEIRIDNSFNGAIGWILWCRITVREAAPALSRWGKFWRRLRRALQRIGEPV